MNSIKYLNLKDYDFSGQKPKFHICPGEAAISKNGSALDSASTKILTHSR